MKTWHMVIDVARCHDCNDCFLADRDEYVGNDFRPTAVSQPAHGHRWMNIKRKEGGQFPIVRVAYLPMPCMHCEAAPCLTTDGAVYRRDDGLVIIDPDKAKGRKDIVASCPYSAIYWNEEEEVAQKCTGCAHLIDDGWTETRCSQVCPTDAVKLHLLEDAEMEAMVAAESLERYRDSLGTKPRVYYKNLHRWERVFVGCSVVFADTDECGAGAVLSVVADDGSLAGKATASAFGEVVVDALELGRAYTVLVEAPGYAPYSANVSLDQSANLGQVVLDRA